MRLNLQSPRSGAQVKGPRHAGSEGWKETFVGGATKEAFFYPGVFVTAVSSSISPQLSQAGDLIMEVYIEQQLPDNCVTLKVSL